MGLHLVTLKIINSDIEKLERLDFNIYRPYQSPNNGYRAAL